MIFLKSSIVLLIATIGITGASQVDRDVSVVADTSGLRGLKEASTRNVEAVEGHGDDLLGIEEPDDISGELLLFKDKTLLIGVDEDDTMEFKGVDGEIEFEEEFNDVVVGLGGCQNTRGKQCWTKKCCSSMYCSTAQKCENKRTEGEKCDAVRRCASGLICSFSGKCYRSRTWGQSCHLDRRCASGLSCQPGVHKCYNSPRQFEEPCSAGYNCGSGLSCQPGVHKCYHSPRWLLEPCASGSARCASDYNCKPATHVCVIPCSSKQESKELAEKYDEIRAKEAELEAVKQELEAAVNYYAAKLRGETSFIAEDLQAYEQQTEFCTVVDIDTFAATVDICSNYTDNSSYTDFCNDPENENVTEIYCNITACNDPEDVTGEYCNDDVTSGEVLVHGDLLKVKQIEAEIEVLIGQANEKLEELQQNDDDYDDCMEYYEEMRALGNGLSVAFGGAVADFLQFVDDQKCLIIPILLKLLAIAIDKLAANLGPLAPAIKAMQAQPQCLTAVQWSSFSIQIPGGVVTGQMVYKMVEYFLCFLADLDETLSFFADVCTVTSVVGQLVDTLIAGLCGRIGTAFISITEPFIMCNLWDDCAENSDYCVCPFEFDKCSADELLIGFASSSPNDSEFPALTVPVEI